MTVNELRAALDGMDGDLEVFVRSEGGTMQTTGRAAYETAVGLCVSKFKPGINCWGDEGFFAVYGVKDDAGSVKGVVIE